MSHLSRVPAGLAAFAGNSLKYRSMAGAYMAHMRSKGLEDSINFQEYSRYEMSYTTNEREAMKVADDLPMSRKEFTQMLEYKRDIDIMRGPIYTTALMGGLSLIGLPTWANSPDRLPSTFFKTEEEVVEAGKQRELEVHLKHAPACGHRQARFVEPMLGGDARHNAAFDSIAHGFTAPKDAKAIRKLGQDLMKAWESPTIYYTATVESFRRHGEGIDAYRFLGKSVLHTSWRAMTEELVAHYRLLRQEDQLIQKEGLASLSDFELYQICHRRLVARWEEELTRSQLEARLQDWMTIAEVKDGEENVPIRVLLMYQAAHFRDAGYLEETLESLDKPAFPTALTWAKDAFERRLEFETGPLADHVKAHLAEVEKKEQALTAKRTEYLSKSA